MTSSRINAQTRAALDPRDRDRVLWVNVVLQAIRDATEAKGIESQDLERQRARHWFRLTNSDFIEVCHLADLDPAATYEKAMRAIERYDAIIASGAKYQVEHHEQPKPKPRRPQLYTYKGEARSLNAWSSILGIPQMTLKSRINSGYTVDEAFSTSFTKRRHQTFNRPAGRKGRLYTINGESKTVTEWSAIHRIDARLVRSRLQKGYAIELALTAPNTGHRPAKVHTINGVSKTLAEWAADAGIKLNTLHARMRNGRPLAEALAMPNGRHAKPGVVSDFEAFEGTGAGGTAQEIPEITFSTEAATK